LALQERPVGDIVAASVAASTAEAERASGRGRRFDVISNSGGTMISTESAIEPF